MDLQGFGAQLLAGAWLTIQLAVCASLLGSALGFATMLAKVSDSRMLRAAGFGFANLFRALPELLVILIVYFGLPQLLMALSGQRVEVGPFMAGVIALSLIFCAYSSEVFRGAWRGIPKGQVEAAMAGGMGPWLILRRIRFPQIVRLSLPSLGNLWLVLLKDTSLVAVIGLQELMRKAQMATSVTKDPFTFYGTAALLYVAISVVSSAGLQALERRSRRGLAA